MTATNPNAGEPAAPATRCGCCGGTRQVLDIVGQPRPCSRCGDPEEFHNWYAARLAAEREDTQ